MIVDAELLRMGAAFSDSAGAIAKRGADQLAATSISAGVFGDFEAADNFLGALRQTHEARLTSMQAHHRGLSALAEKANLGAKSFSDQDDASESGLHSAGHAIG